MIHKLVISSDGDYRDWDVEHLDCPSSLSRGYLEWTCPVGWYIDEFGFSDEIMGLPDGEYQIEFWQESYPNYTGDMETNFGLELVQS